MGAVESTQCQPASCCRPEAGHAGPKEVEFLGHVSSGVREFPMYVISFKDFLELEAVLSHEELMAKGVLISYTEQLGPALFVSHQWCTPRHPDPDFEQMRVLQAALRRVLSGEVKIEMGLYAAWLSGLGQGSNEVDLEDLQSAYIWYDYFAIPQLTSHAFSGPATELTDFHTAVRSIPSYVEQCDYFIILAPPILRSDLKEFLDYSSWCSRGWCRVERLVMHLSFNKMPVILVQSSHQLVFMPALDYFQKPPGLGSFSLESDKVLIRELLEGVVLRQLEELLDQGKLHHYRMLMSLREAIFEGLGNGRHLQPQSIVTLLESAAIQRSQALTHLDTFLLKYGFGSPVEKDEAGWAPLHYAAAAGDVVVMQSLIALQADVSAALPHYDFDFCVMAGHTPIALSVRFSRNVAATRCLLLSGVNANEPITLMGSTALHAWPQMGSNEVLDCLLAFRADLNLVNKLGMRAVHFAAILGKASDMGLLVKARASAGSSSFGATPLHIASIDFQKSARHARMLVEGGCAVDAKVDLRYDSPLGFLACAGIVLHRLGHDGYLSKGAFYASGATALSLAMGRGNFGFALGLLEARADPQLKNDCGVTAFEAAEMHGVHFLACSNHVIQVTDQNKQQNNNKTTTTTNLNKL
ncbi:unnamed protein product [Polarella glacialis]|uniref:Uncharacterized protein n=1 Tax=Polarella glacialis TaxID=89957 RepID=A0A813FHC0_POLGL|nr:unnamed protein product [Polarella glacialis]